MNPNKTDLPENLPRPKKRGRIPEGGSLYPCTDKENSVIRTFSNF